MTVLEPLFTVAEVAKALNVSERFVQDKCRRKAWPHRRLSRSFAFTGQDYDAILELSAAASITNTEPTGLSFAPRARRSA
jgi:hypothetical protein